MNLVVIEQIRDLKRLRKQRHQHAEFKSTMLSNFPVPAMEHLR